MLYDPPLFEPPEAAYEGEQAPSSVVTQTGLPVGVLAHLVAGLSAVVSRVVFPVWGLAPVSFFAARDMESSFWIGPYRRLPQDLLR